MEWRLVPQMLAAFGFFGMIFICPLVMLFLRHQRLMADLIHRNAGNESMQRLEAVEKELRDLRAEHHALVLREDDQRELRQRVN